MLSSILFYILVAVTFERSQANWCYDYWVTRGQWGGDSLPVGGDENYNVYKVFFHHTVTPECYDMEKCSARVRSMQQHHLNIGFDDLGYNFVIGGDGNIYVVRGFEREGQHTKGHNSNSISIAFIGNFDKKVPSSAMLAAAKDIIKCGVESGGIVADYGLYGHRDGSCTLSPGSYFYLTLRNWPRWHARGEIKKNC